MVFRSASSGGLLLLLSFASPLSAIVIADPAYSAAVDGSNPYYDNVDLNGVVSLSINGDIGCSGSLLSDGFSILTAAHCITPADGPGSVVVSFLTTGGGFVSDAVSAYFIDPSYTGTGTAGGDLAVLHLANEAPSTAARYALYTGSTPDYAIDPNLPPEVIAGYGYGGTGLTGADTAFGTLRVGANEYVTTGRRYGWSSTLLLGEFYGGVDPANPLRAANPYTAGDEVDIAPGDSGGPSFYDDEIIGVHDISACFVSGCNLNSVFGDVYGDTSVAANAVWIEDEELPEPASSVLLGLGLAALAAFRFRSPRTSRPGRLILRDSIGKPDR
jgi:hypothetical protein